MMQNQLPSMGSTTLGRYLSRHYGDNDGRFLQTSAGSKSDLAIYRKRSDRPEFGHVSAPALADGYLVAVSLKGDHQQRSCNGRLSETRAHAVDSLHIRNLTEDYSAYICSPFDFLFFHVTRDALDAIAQESGARRIDGLSCPPGVLDPIAASLGRALLPALNSPTEASALFVDHVALAINMHLAQTYGGLRMPAARQNGRLSRQQERRAKDFLRFHSSDDVSIAAVAAECGLSRSYFIKAFKETTGKTPHKWLLGHRVEQAKALLVQAGASIADIAAACGFADQSHLTRVFTNLIGMPPGAWRRENGA
jgi:AraC family transcriptional regulator